MTSFAEYFEMGRLETSSPFLQPNSRRWSVNLTLKAAFASAILLVSAFVLSFFAYFTPLSNFFLVAIYFLAGVPSLIEAFEDLKEGDINIDILMTLAAFSSIFIGSSMEGALLLVLFALSGAMEDAVTNKAKGAISSLSKLSPTKATIVEQDGTLIEKALRDIPVKTRILVRAGQIIPLDGIVVDGTSSVNLVHLTGENFPVTKGVKDTVPAGAFNLEGALTVEVTHTSNDSTLARIIELVTEAQEARPPLQRTFDKFSKGYAITIISLTAFFALTFPYLLNIPLLGREGSIYRAVAFLIAASPCALIIAIPIAYLSALSSTAKKGILLKGGITLDALTRCGAIAFDKTGTLTTGELVCTAIEPITAKLSDEQNLGPSHDQTLMQALAVAYALEKNAVHPIASAIAKYSLNFKLDPIELQSFISVPGYGLKGVARLKDGDKKVYKKVYIGRPVYIKEQLPLSLQQELQQRVALRETDGELLAALLIDQDLFLLRFRDTPRPKIREMLDAVRSLGKETIMLTGDHFQSAKRIANELGIEEFHADLTPEDKLNYVANLAEKKGLAMIGDGVNDAPALARATVGICMGKVGSNAAVDAADVVLLHDNIELLDWLFKKAVATKKIVTENLILAVGAIFFASIPALSGLIPLWLAVVMHEGGTVLVGLNALRLLKT